MSQQIFPGDMIKSVDGTDCAYKSEAFTASLIRGVRRLMPPLCSHPCFSLPSDDARAVSASVGSLDGLFRLLPSLMRPPPGAPLSHPPPPAIDAAPFHGICVRCRRRALAVLLTATPPAAGALAGPVGSTCNMVLSRGDEDVSVAVIRTLPSHEAQVTPTSCFWASTSQDNVMAATMLGLALTNHPGVSLNLL